MRHPLRRLWLTGGTFGAVLALGLAGGARPVAAQAYDPDSCAAVKEQVAYLTGVGDFVQQAGLHEGVDLLAENQTMVDLFCDPAGDNPPSKPTPSNPARSDPPSTDPPSTDPPSTDPPAVTPPAAAPPDPAADDGNPSTRKDACVLVTEREVGVAMKQSVTASEGDPAGFPDAQGCQFAGQGAGYTDIIYIQGNGAFFYDSLRATAEPNGVQAVSGLGDRAFSYVGDGGPGLVVAKGDKLFALEYNGIGSGPAEKSSLMVLAQQAVGRVH